MSHHLRSFVSAMAVALAALPALAAPPEPAHSLQFRDDCPAGTRIIVAGVGDLLFHSSLQRRALSPKGRYSDFWAPVDKVIAGADIAYGNLEGPAAHGVAIGGRDVKDPGRRLDGRVYGPSGPVLSGLVFNYHPSVVADMKESGFDIVSTANNHAADRGPLGIDRTIDAFEAQGLAFSGTRRRGEVARPWSAVTEAKGVRVAWLACSYSANGMPHENQILGCYARKDAVLSEIRRLAGDPAVDAVIFTPHWGVEKSHRPLASDRLLGLEAIEAGAVAVIGTHTHVLQPWEKVTTVDGREGLVIYSTGNFVSNQPWAPTRVGVIALLELTRPSQGKAKLTAAGYVPTEVQWGAHGHRVIELRGKASRLLPAGNRVAMDRFRELPGSCANPVSATSGVATDAAVR